MVETVRSLTNVLANLPDNTTGLISPEDVRDAVVSLNARAGGRTTVKDDTAVQGDGVTQDFAALTTLLTAGGHNWFPQGTYLVGTGAETALANSVTLEGVHEKLSIIKATAAPDNRWIPKNSLYLRHLNFDGAGQKDFFNLKNAGAVILDEVRIENCRFEPGTVGMGIHSAGAAQITGLEINHCFLFGNVARAPKRGFMLYGNGSDDLIILGNYVKDSERIGIQTGIPNTAVQGVSTGMVCMANVIHNCNFGTTNSNGLRLDGIGGVMVGNVVNNMISATNPQADLEGYYDKTHGYTICSNVAIDAGGGEGFINLKGKIRADVDEPDGWLKVCSNNILIRNASYNQDSFGINCNAEDLIIAGNAMTGMNKFSIYNSSAHAGLLMRNMLVVHNLITLPIGPDNIRFKGAWQGITIGNNHISQIDFNGSRQAIELTPQTTATLKLVKITGNLIHGTVSYPAQLMKMIRLNPNTGATIDNVYVHGNLLSGSGLAAAEAHGIVFDAAGTVSNTYLDGNVFADWPDATKMIANLTSVAGGRTAGSVKIFDNPGFVNDSEGQATVTNGTSAATVNHLMTQASGFTATPNAGNIFITARTPLRTAVSWAISSITATQFVLTTYDAAGVAVNVGADFTFDWHVRKTTWAFA